jgi:undecaprenyl-diphosphatase
MPVHTALKIGLCQAVAMIPGVSRSGATIVGAMMFRVDRRAAAEFSFFLSMPTMLGAFTVDFLQNRDQLVSEDLAIIATGFAFAFLAGLAVVRVFLAIVSRMGFAPFAWYRIVLGAVMLGVLSVV